MSNEGPCIRLDVAPHPHAPVATTRLAVSRAGLLDGTCDALLPLQGGNAPKCSGAHPSFEQHPLTSSRLWADTTFLPADSPGRMIEHHHAVSGASACTSARTDCGAEAEKASSLAATHDTLFLDEALLFGDDLHHEAFLIEGTEHDAQVPGARGRGAS